MILTLSDFLTKFAGTGPQATVIFKDEDGDIEFERLIAVSPSTEITLVFATKAEYWKQQCDELETANKLMTHDKKERDRNIACLIDAASQETWTRGQILDELKTLL